MGRKAQVAVPGQVHGLVHRGVVGDAVQPRQLRQADGKGHLGAQGYPPGGVLELGPAMGLERAPAAQAVPQERVGQPRVAGGEVGVPGVGDPFPLAEDDLEGPCHCDATLRCHP